MPVESTVPSGGRVVVATPPTGTYMIEEALSSNTRGVRFLRLIPRQNSNPDPLSTPRQVILEAVSSLKDINSRPASRLSPQGVHQWNPSHWVS
jgi:hypothetical protein